MAAHYGIPTINLAKEVTGRIDAGEFTWEDDFNPKNSSGSCIIGCPVLCSDQIAQKSDVDYQYFKIINFVFWVMRSYF